MSNQSLLNPDADINDNDNDVNMILEQNKDNDSDDEESVQPISLPVVTQIDNKLYDIEDIKENNVVRLEMKNIDFESVEITYDPAKSQDLVVALMAMYPDIDASIITYTVSKTCGNENASQEFLDNLILKPDILGAKIKLFSSLAIQVLNTYHKIYDKRINNTKENIAKAVIKLCQYDPSLTIFFIQFQVSHSIKDRVTLTSAPINMTGIQQSIYNLKMEIEYCNTACYIREQTNIKNHDEALALLRESDLDVMLALNKYYQKFYD